MSAIVPTEVAADEKSVQMLWVRIARQKLIRLANIGVYKGLPIK